MTRLDEVKQVIKMNCKNAMYGIFDTRNAAHDIMTTIYLDDNVQIDICYEYEYFEVFGLSDEEFSELAKFYNDWCVYLNTFNRAFSKLTVLGWKALNYNWFVNGNRYVEFDGTYIDISCYSNGVQLAGYLTIEEWPLFSDIILMQYNTDVKLF